MRAASSVLVLGLVAGLSVALAQPSTRNLGKACSKPEDCEPGQKCIGYTTFNDYQTRCYIRCDSAKDCPSGWKCGSPTFDHGPRNICFRSELEAIPFDCGPADGGRCDGLRPRAPQPGSPDAGS